METYETPTVALESREFQKNASWHLHFTWRDSVWLAPLNMARCRGLGTWYVPAVSFGWFYSRVKCWHWHW